MLKEIKKQTAVAKGELVAEIEVLDTDDNKSYFVVSKITDTVLYSTFDGSYIDYLNGLRDKPNVVEDDFLENTKFGKYYNEALNIVPQPQGISSGLKRKYSHLKKPLGNVKYEIVEKKSAPRFACGPMGNAYELKFHLLDDGKYLYIYSSDAYDFYALSDFSYFELEEKMIGGEDPVIPDPIESFEGFYKAKKSKYYDLYLEMERFRDGLPSLLEK